METHKLFSTPARARILERVLSDPQERLRVRRIAKELGVSPASVSKYLAVLRGMGIVDGTVRTENPIVRALKLLINMEKACCAVGRLKKIRWARGVGIYGSWANGTNTRDSDIDIWMLADEPVAEIELAKAQAALKKSLGVECSILLLTRQKLAQMREKDPALYYALVNSFVVRGAGID